MPLSKTKNILAKTLDGEIVILKKEDRKCYLLNRTASHLWRLVNGKNSAKTLAKSLSRKYKIKFSSAEKDTKVLLAYLAKHNLLNLRG